MAGRRIREKEREQINKEKQRCADQIGSGVPREAQLLFNGLAKTMQCTWQGRDIVVDYQRTCGGDLNFLPTPPSACTALTCPCRCEDR